MDKRKTTKECLGSQRKGCADLLLDVISVVAESNATSLCKGFMYEPELPKKMRK